MAAARDDRSLVDALVAVQKVLDEQGIASALCGGLAANLYREDVRSTVDVDVYLVCTAPQLVQLARAFEAKDWTVHPAWQQAELLRLEHKRYPRVDMLIATTEFEREAVLNGRPVVVAGQELRVLEPEDLIVFKLVAGRARDYGDVVAIINSSDGRLDEAYIARALDDLDMVDRWKRAQEDAARERP